MASQVKSLLTHLHERPVRVEGRGGERRGEEGRGERRGGEGKGGEGGEEGRCTCVYCRST